MKRSECKVIERDRVHYYEICETPTGEWYFEALVSGAAMYSLTICLTDEETEQYRADPCFARDLTYRLAKGDPELKTREVPNLEG